jgi:hypothetical protein
MMAMAAGRPPDEEDGMDRRVTGSLEFESDTNVRNALRRVGEGAGRASQRRRRGIRCGGRGSLDPERRLWPGDRERRDHDPQWGLRSDDREWRCLDRERGDAVHHGGRKRDDRPQGGRRFRPRAEGDGRGRWEGRGGSESGRVVRGDGRCRRRTAPSSDAPGMIDEAWRDSRLDQASLVLVGSSAAASRGWRRVLDDRDHSRGHEAPRSDGRAASSHLGDLGDSPRGRHLHSATRLRGLDLVLEDAVPRVHDDLYTVASHGRTLPGPNDTRRERVTRGAART